MRFCDFSGINLNTEFTKRIFFKQWQAFHPNITKTEQIKLIYSSGLLLFSIYVLFVFFFQVNQRNFVGISPVTTPIELYVVWIVR